MFCYQCEEAAKNTACTIRGTCGRVEEVAGLQDLLLYALKGLAFYAEAARDGDVDPEIGNFIADILFSTITNANFNEVRFVEYIGETLRRRDALAVAYTGKGVLPDAATFQAKTSAEMYSKAAEAAIPLLLQDEDDRSLVELLIYGLKGLAAYAHHAAVLGKESANIWNFHVEALAFSLEEHSIEERIAMVMKAGELAVETMALLDAANVGSYGAPELSEVNIGVGERPGILISGHDLKDLEMLLAQTEGSGVDVYTHCEMLPGHYYPAFKKYDHLVGNYGNAWWQQDKEFAAFNGPILMTTNCITPVKASYVDRIYTTGVVGFEGVKHIEADAEGSKDFSALIEQAKGCEPPTSLEEGKIVGGFAHQQVMALADKVVSAVKGGDVKRFIVMAGCDGRKKSRNYYTEVAQELPKDTIILTAGCAKFRYNKLDLGDIGGIPRVLDAGQCNDSYSLAVIALKLKEVFGLDDINDLPISYDIAWYEQKAVIVLLALLYLGVKNIRLGPSLPSFLSPGVAKFLVETFDLKPIGGAQEDVAAMMLGA